jgi:hypothetical protein
MGQALKAGDPQTFVISARPRPTQVCTALNILCWDMPLRPALPEVQTCMISVRLGHHPKASTSLQELCFTGLHPVALHNLCFGSQAPKACRALQNLCSARPQPQGLPCQRYKHVQSPYCWAMPPKPAQPCTVFTLQACAPKVCQTGDPHKHDLHSSVLRLPSLSSWGSTDMQNLHSASLCPSGRPNPCFKGLLLHLN